MKILHSPSSADALGEDADSGTGERTSPISRALSLLDVIADAGGEARFAEVQKASPLPKATLSRLLRQLEAEGMLIFDAQTQRYKLGLRLIRLAHAAWESASLVAIARPVIDRLAARLGVTIHLATLENGQVLYLDKRVPRPTIAMFSSPGRIGPAYCTGVGKAMLAFLPEAARVEAMKKQNFFRYTPQTIATIAALARELEDIAARGFALDREEHEASVICVAVPIRTDRGNLLGALSATSTTHLLSLEDLTAFVPDLMEAAREIAASAHMQMIER